MTQDQRPVIIKPTMDATGVRAGAEDVKSTVRDMSRAVQAEGQKAAAGVEAIGEGGKRGADDLDRGTRSMIASIQRAQAAALAGGKTTADYFEALAKQRGLSADVLRPYIDGLRAAEAAQAAATGSLGSMGASARQTAAALRGVPAQFTDIVTALASGQQPLTVFLQQGGQLKDMFGGAGAAAQALGGYVVGLINPFTVLAAIVGTVTAGFLLGQKEAAEYSKALILSGNAVGVTSARLGEMAAAIDSVSGATQGKAAEVLTQLASAGAVGAENLQRFAQAAIELERAGGPAASETAKAFEALAREPLAASIKLTESTRFLSAAVAEQIADLERQGRAIDAARLAQQAYAEALEERTPKMQAQLGSLQRGWKFVGDAAREAWDAILGIGRPTDQLTEQIEFLQRQMDARVRQRRQAGPGEREMLDVDIGRMQAQLTIMRAQVSARDEAAAAAGRAAQQEQAGIKWLQEGEKYLSSQQRLASEIATIRALGVAAGKTEAEIAERIAAARERANGKGDSTAAREQQRALEQQRSLLAELSGLSSTYAEDLQRLESARARGVITEERFITLMRELVSRQPAVKRQAQEIAEAARIEAKSVAEAAEAYAKYVAGLDANLAAGQRTIDQLQLELVELRAGKAARLELELQERERLALTYEQAAMAAELDRTDGSRYRKLAAQVREEIRLRRQLATATEQRDVQRANERAAEDAAREWDRTAEQIGQSLSDAIFQGGKGAGDLLKRYFATLVLKPIIDAQLRPIVDALGSALGLPGAGGAAAAGGGGQLLGSLGNIGTALGLGNIGATLRGIAPAISSALLGRSLGGLLSNGYSIGGSSRRTVNAGTLLGGVLGGPVGSVVGGALGGVVNSLFGRKLKDSGFEGTFGVDGDFTGRQFQFFKGGLLRSNKTKRSPLDGDLAAVLDAGGAAAFAQAKAYAEVLGLPVEALEGYTQKIKVSLKGLSEEQAQRAVADAVQSFQDGLLGRFSQQLEPLRRTSETLSDVAARVAGLQVFAEGMQQLGGVFGRVAASSLDARQQLIEMAGGLDTLTSQTQSFVQQYYSREEIAGVKARELQGVLSAAGITQEVRTRDDFRALVEATDISTQAGRQQLAQLLAVAGDFAQVADYLAETGGTLAGAAALAPQTLQLPELFSLVRPVEDVREEIRLVNTQMNFIVGSLQDWLRGWTAEVGGGA